MNSFTAGFSARVSASVLLVALVGLAGFNVVVESHSKNTRSAHLPNATYLGNSSSSAGGEAALRAEPVIVPPVATYTVDTTADFPILSACTAAPLDCSLRGAIIAANSNPGSTIVVPAGTYLLTISGAGEQFAATGDLDVRASGTNILGAGAATTIIQQTTGDRVFEINPVPQLSSFTFSISGVTIKDGNTTGSGAGILGGGLGSSTTITDCVFDNDRVTGTVASNGGAISITSTGAADLTITGTTFTNNTTATGIGGAIRYSSLAGTLTVTGSAFSGNKANTNSGGAINATGPGTGGTYNIKQSSFVGNQALGTGMGGAIFVGPGSLAANFSRFVGNTAGAATGKTVAKTVGTTGASSIDDDWWGINAGPGVNDVAGPLATIVTWLQLRHVANPNSICPNATTTLTADLLGRSSGGAANASDLVGLPAFTATFINTTPSLGSLSGASSQFVDGQATATFTSSGGGGTANIDATADNETVTASIVIGPDNATTLSDQAVCPGGTATFSTTASGLGPFTFVWKKGSTVLSNGGNISIVSTADTSTLTITNVQASDADTYTVEATGFCNTATQSATLTVQPPTATTDPADATVCQGATANFSTTASGGGPFHYAWTLDGSPFNGDSASISVDTTSLSAGNHTVAVTATGACGSASQSATLTVLTNTTTTDPTDQTVCQGATANFSTTASGTGPFHYAWTLDGSPFDGDNSSINVPTGSLSVSNHTVAVTTTGACGSASQSATLTVQANTSATTPADQAVCPGVTANFSTTASGTGPFHYAWTVDGSPFNGDSPSISVPTGSLSSGNHPVSVTVSGTCGSTTKNATLTVSQNTSTTDPADQNVCAGGTASFSTTASGTGPFGFVWKKGSTVLNNGDFGGRVTIVSGSSSSTLTITNVQASDVGTYSVATSGSCNIATQSATLAVDSTPPSITCPSNITVESTCPSGAVVTYTAPVGADTCPGATTTRTAGLASGSVFPIGTTTVTYTVTDTTGNSASCSFTVTVKTAAQTVQDMITAVQAITPPLSGTQSQGLIGKLQAAQDAINQGKTNVACNKLMDFINQVQGYINSGTLTSAQGQPLINSANHVRNTIGCTNLGCT